MKQKHRTESYPNSAPVFLCIITGNKNLINLTEILMKSYEFMSLNAFTIKLLHNEFLKK